ncbi:MAG: TonB-dependent receptor domain-containing protein [Marinomonas foliarum]
MSFNYQPKKTVFKKTVLAMAITQCLIANAYGEDSKQKEESAIDLSEVEIVGSREIDEAGQDAVYDENVTSVYQDREQLQRFKATNPGDIFKGMNGVYSMDTRGSQSITPNIRGITGEGRTPLTIDGTEQSSNVWLHFFGSGNRNYIDPAMLRSVEVEKGPSLSRGLKSGVGGAVSARTIEASDIIPKGKNWGIEMNLETSGNTGKPEFDAASYYGKDYRDVPGAKRVSTTGVSIDSPQPRIKSDSDILNFEDHSEMLTIAGRNELTDVLLSHSKRTSGNYYAGKNNADEYEGHDSFDKTTTDRFIPNLTKLYYPGNEVFNTASETETTLLKNNWYLPNEQKIGLQFMRTDSTFGETTPGNTILMWAYREGAENAQPDLDWSKQPQFVYELPHSELQVDRYKLSYEIKPKDSDWLNLETSLWHTKTEGKRNQTGLSPFGIGVDASTELALYNYDWYLDQGFTAEQLEAYGMFEPEHDGTIVSHGNQWTTHDRTGFDLNNQMKLADNLMLTVGGSYQKETLEEQTTPSKYESNGIAPDLAGLHIGTDLHGPRSGERQEYSAMFNLAWQPTEWLTLTAGASYLNYKGKDTGTAKRRSEGNDFYAAKRRKDGVELTYNTVMTPEEVDLLQDYWSSPDPADAAALIELRAGRTQFQDQLGKFGPTDVWYWENTKVVPIIDGKMDSSQNPFANGEFDINEVVENPFGEGYVNTVTPGGDKVVYQDLDADQAWEAPEEQTGDAFSPVLSATARITPFSTAFLRYAQTTRFPSINELTTSSAIKSGTVGAFAVNGASKPERNINWEVGYSHNLTQFFPDIEVADVRLSYYNTTIKDFIDRGYLFDVIQFDKKKTSGLELQSRFDTGRYFGSLGATYRLEQKLCDKDYASSMDPFYNRIPECITGGFPGTYSGSSLQPKYSIDMGLGARLLNNRLEFGWRGVYHAGAENKQLDKLLSSENPDDWGLNQMVSDMWFRGGVDTFYWKPVLLHDLYANYSVNEFVTLNLGVTNVMDEYYIDPMSKSLLPGPGRTVTAGLKARF